MTAHVWLAVGWAGQAFFFVRFFLQWWRSEQAGRSVAPRPFWWFSIAGTVLLAAYTAHLGDPILLAGYGVNAIVYVRNLRFGSGRGTLPLPALAAVAMVAIIVLFALQVIGLRAGFGEAPLWVVVGLVGQCLWSARFIVQWIVAELRGESGFSRSFWWFSLAGNVLLFAYAVHLNEAVLIAGYSLGPIVQVRNLLLGRSSRRPERRPASAVLPIAWPLLLVPILASAAVRGLWGADENRYAEVAREIYEPGLCDSASEPAPRATGLVMYLCGEVYPDKPPLLFWLAGGLGKLFGWHELVLRLPNLLAMAGTAWLVLLLARRWWGPVEASWAPAIFLGSTMVVHYGGRLQLDPLLTFLCTASIVLADAPATTVRRASGLALGSGLLVGLAALTKGPVAYLNVGLPLLLWRVLVRSPADAARASRGSLAGAALLAIGPVLAWASAVSVIVPEIADELFFRQHVQRAVQGTQHWGPFWQHLFRQPPLLLPWLPAIVAGLVYAMSSWCRGRGNEDRGQAKAAWWFLALFVFFSITPAKRDLYLFPMYPAAALLGARFLAPFMHAKRLPRAVAWFGVALLALAGIGFFVAPLVTADVPGLAWRGPLIGGVVLACAALVVYRILANDALRWGREMVAGWALGCTCVALLLYPAIDESRSPRSLAASIADLGVHPETVPCVSVRPYGFRFYASLPAVIAQRDLSSYLAQEGSEFLGLVRMREWTNWSDLERALYRVVLVRRLGSREILVVRPSRSSRSTDVAGYDRL